MTPSTIETAARNRLNAISSTFWSSTEIIEECLLFAIMEVIGEASCAEVTNSFSSVASTGTYNFPAGATDINRIEYDGQKLQPFTRQDFDAMNLAGFTAPVGRPLNYYLYGETIVLYPTPSEVKTIRVFSQGLPTAFTAASTLPIPLLYHPRLVNGVCFYMLQKETEDPRLTAFAELWRIDREFIVASWRRRKSRDVAPRVRQQEMAYTTDLGLV